MQLAKVKTSKQNTEEFEVVDHAISGETFSLKKHPDLDMWMTFPTPENLQSYYESEDYLSHSDKRATLFEKCYQWVKSVRTKRKLSWLRRTLGSTGKLLDVGTGTGEFIKAAKAKGWKVSGVEPNPSARKIALEKGIDVVAYLGDMKSGDFDVVTLWHVLEHLPNLEESIGKIKALIKPNGILVLALPNYKSWDAQHYGPYWAGYDVPRHLWHFSKSSVLTLFGNSGFELEKIRPMYMDAFYISLLSEKYRHRKMRWASAIFNGIRSNIDAIRTKEHSSLVYVLKRPEKSI